MSNRPVTNKEELLDAAYAIACEKGLAGVNVRAVARACDVAVGTVYNWYPTKSELISDVIARFWREALADCMPRASKGCDFIDFCREVHLRSARAFSSFRDGWLAEVSSMAARDLSAAREREQACFAHVRQGLEVALRNDAGISHEKLEGDIVPSALCTLVWDAILASLRRNDDSCTALFALIREALY